MDLRTRRPKASSRRGTNSTAASLQWGTRRAATNNKELVGKVGRAQKRDWVLWYLCEMGNVNNGYLLCPVLYALGDTFFFCFSVHRGQVGLRSFNLSLPATRPSILRVLPFLIRLDVQVGRSNPVYNTRIDRVGRPSWSGRPNPWPPLIKLVVISVGQS